MKAKKKRKKIVRDDVKKRKENQKKICYSTVKCSWKQFCKNNFIKDGIEDVVYNINKISFEAYKLANYHVLRLITKNISVNLTQNFFYKCCTLVSEFKNRKNNKCKDLELQKSFDIYKTFRPTDYKIAYKDKMGALINNLTRQMITATKNHLALNFYKRFTKFLSLKTGETRRGVLYHWFKDIYNDKYTGKNPFILYWKQKLKYKPTETNIKKYSSHFIKIYYLILKEFEKYKCRRGIRTFTLLPNKNNFTLSNITICNESLNDLISKFSKKSRYSNFIKDKDKYWREYFLINKYETVNRKYDKYI